MTDPRKEPQWKQKRYEERVLLLLGAILDAVATPAAPAPAPTPTLTRTRKQNA